MKRTYILYNVAAALALLTCACSRSVGDGLAAAEDELSFSPALTQSSTKTIFDSSVFPTDQGAFSVSAVVLDGVKQTLYFFNKSVEYADSKWGFKADASGIRPRYYWPLAGGMNFYAFYPESEVLTTRKIVPTTDPVTGETVAVPALAEGGIAYRNYTIKHSSDEAGGYVPITSDADKNDSNLENAQLDFMSATQLYDDVSTRTSSSVPLLFMHNLAQIQFMAVPKRDLSVKATVGNGVTNFEVINHVSVTVDRIELMNIYSTGSYYNIAPHWRDLKEKYNYFPLTCAEGQGTELGYMDDEHKDDIGHRTPERRIVTRNGLTEPARMLLIPQSLTDAKMKVWFSVRQKTVRNEGRENEFLVNDYLETYIRTIDMASLISEFKISTCVTFVFNIDLDDIDVSVSYGDWKSDGEITPVI